jgi:hypothetical protein
MKDIKLGIYGKDSDNTWQDGHKIGKKGERKIA